MRPEHVGVHDLFEGAVDVAHLDIEHVEVDRHAVLERVTGWGRGSLAT